ncbi:Site-specific recombinase XerD [Lachnospiraceae bacterium XPB1003]|nr:Site-specific recombinase XerD [Lachnospiraceae bacterium XPB1003]
MANKTRKDKKGYMLRTGECQRKDGRYSYAYTDRWKKRHVVYATSLVELRELEKQIRMDLDSGIDPNAAKTMTVNDVFDRYISRKYDLKPTTKSNYQFNYDHFVREGFGQEKIGKIRYSDVKKFYYDLMKERGIKPRTLDGVNTVLHSTFKMAVRDEIIRSNHAEGVMAEIKKSDLWVKTRRRGLTVPEQRELVEFMKDSHQFKGWVPVITVLLGTGMRIGECLGLRWEDIDLDKRLISVNHNLVDYQDRDIKKQVRKIQTTKTRAGVRMIPMIDEVYEAFITEFELQSAIGFCEEEIDGYSGFIFTTTDQKLMSRSAVNNALHRIVRIHNEEEEKKAKAEGREPILIPQLSAHHLRHTFCTRFCENETNLKVIQSIMGHSDITTTMDIYADATPEKKQEIMANLNGKIF